MIFASSSGCCSAIAALVLCRLFPLVSFTTSLFACQQLQWTAKRPKSGQRDTIPADLVAVLNHFEVQQDHWLETVEQYESLFGHTSKPECLPSGPGSRAGSWNGTIARIRECLYRR